MNTDQVDRSVEEPPAGGAGTTKSPRATTARQAAPARRTGPRDGVATTGAGRVPVPRRRPAPTAGEPDQDDSDSDDDYIADRGQWEELKGPTLRGLRRNPVLDRLGWYQVLDRDATITSTRQVVATNPALIRSQPPFSGSPRWH